MIRVLAAVVKSLSSVTENIRDYIDLNVVCFLPGIESRISRIKEFLFYHSDNSALIGLT